MRQSAEQSEAISGAIRGTQRHSGGTQRHSGGNQRSNQRHSAALWAELRPVFGCALLEQLIDGDARALALELHHLRRVPRAFEALVTPP